MVYCGINANIWGNRFMRVNWVRLLSALLCVLLFMATMSGIFALADSFPVQEIFFSERDGELWLVGRIEPPSMPLAVVVFLVLPTELSLPEPGVHLYPVDENGYFALPAGPLEEDGVIVGQYILYVCDGTNPPPNDYEEVRRAALSELIFGKAGEPYERVLASAKPFPAEILIANTPMPTPIAAESTRPPTRKPMPTSPWPSSSRSPTRKTRPTPTTGAASSA